MRKSILVLCVFVLAACGHSKSDGKNGRGGERGPAGEQGAQGEKGDAGEPGVAGQSAVVETKECVNELKFSNYKKPHKMVLKMTRFVDGATSAHLSYVYTGNNAPVWSAVYHVFAPGEPVRFRRGNWYVTEKVAHYVPGKRNYALQCK
jgi:hypothetical protein